MLLLPDIRSSSSEAGLMRVNAARGRFSPGHITAMACRQCTHAAALSLSGEPMDKLLPKLWQCTQKDLVNSRLGNK